jgi:hypothetical protein
MGILMQMFLQGLLQNAIFVRTGQADWRPWCGGEKARFMGCCQENILDKQAPDTRFGQCLQGFRVIKKVATMACTNSALCAIMRKQSWIMKAEYRSEDWRRAPESNTKNGRNKAQESQSRFRIGTVLVPSALFCGHSVGANSPDRLIKPIPSPGKPNAGATRPFFASFLSASALAAADALCDFAFNSGAKKSRLSHRVAVSRSDVGEGLHLATLLKRGPNISDNPKYFGNISEKQPFSEKISDLFFGGTRPSRSPGGASRAALPLCFPQQVFDILMRRISPCAMDPGRRHVWRDAKHRRARRPRSSLLLPSFFFLLFSWTHPGVTKLPACHTDVKLKGYIN